MSKYIHILDRAHGNNTPGKRSMPLPGTQNNIYYEWAMSDEVVCEIGRLCDKHGIQWVDLVPEDEDISLPERVARANKIYASNPNCLLWSIHSNANTMDGSFNPAKGWEAWTSPGETLSDKMCDVLYQQAIIMWGKDCIRSDYSDGDHDKEALLYILTHTRMPAVLSENFFHTNIDEVKFLQSTEGRQQIAGVHFNSILEIERNGL